MEEVLDIIFFVGLLYWFWTRVLLGVLLRIKKMVDIATNRIFDAFNRLAPTEKQQNDSLSTISHLKRFSAEQRYRKAVDRQVEVKARESQLLDIKENLPPIKVASHRPLIGLTCYGCAPVSRDSLINKTTKNLPVKNILNDYPAITNKNGILQKMFCHLYQCFAVTPTNYVQVAGSVLTDAHVQNAIEKASTQQYQESGSNDEEYFQKLWKTNEKRAKKLLHDMRSTLSHVVLWFASYALYKLLPHFLSAVVMHSGQLDMVKKASKNGLPLIFLPLHRSHLDYTIISFILYNNNMRCPLIASGDNLKMPVFGSLLRGLGSFFIKRRIDPIMGKKDYVYKSVLHSYMNACLKAGHNIEFFLEGGRTRTGKPLIPKYGIFSVVMDSLINGTIDDAYLVPVSISYEKLVDGDFVKEHLGQPKQMETLSSGISSFWQILKQNYGMVRVAFNQPISLREMVNTFNTNINTNPIKKLKSAPSSTSLYGTDIVSEEHKDLVEKISKHVVYDCSRSTYVMSTNAVAFLLLYKFRNGTTLDELAREIDILKADLQKQEKDVGFSGESIDVANYAIKLLGSNLIEKEEMNDQILFKPKPGLSSVIELNYYSNVLATHLSLESVVALALHTLDDSDCIEEDKLLSESLEICKIFAYEYIFCKPCQSEDSALLDCIDQLAIHKEVIISKCTVTASDMVRNRRIADLFDDINDDCQPFIRQYQISDDQDCQSYLSMLRNALLPLVETYFTCASCLEKLIGQTLLENELIKLILSELKTQFDLGSITYGESVSTELIKNALKLFQKWNILESHTEGKLRIYYLQEEHDNEESIRTLCSRIDKYRFSHMFLDE